jgi:hypothetical protein
MASGPTRVPSGFPPSKLTGTGIPGKLLNLKPIAQICASARRVLKLIGGIDEFQGA